MGSAWSTAMDTIRGALETDGKITCLDQPGKVAPLPAALGGDPYSWPALTAAAKRKESMLALLAAKAHFLMLPKRIIEFVGKSSNVLYSEANPAPGAAADTVPVDGSSSTVEMRIPGASWGLPLAGQYLGRKPLAELGGYAIVCSIYHEMTHATLELSDDPDIQKLFADGLIAYRDAVDAKGGGFVPHQAFSEAAAYYVSDRIGQWCTAISVLDTLMLAPPDDLLLDLTALVEAYDEYVPVYGVVHRVKIDKPELSLNLRHVIDEKILDGLPLTKPFDKTPLADLRASLLSH
jgi:hypothetical protein